MNKDQSNENNNKDNEEDHKPTAQEKRHAEETQADSESDDSIDDVPMKKKHKKNSFNLGYEILQQHIEFDGDRPTYINTRRLHSEVQEAHQ